MRDADPAQSAETVLQEDSDDLEELSPAAKVATPSAATADVITLTTSDTTPTTANVRSTAAGRKRNKKILVTSPLPTRTFELY